MSEFLDLNEKIGGIDSDGDFTARRSLADPKGIQAACETGFFNAGVAMAWDQWQYSTLISSAATRR